MKRKHDEIADVALVGYDHARIYVRSDIMKMWSRFFYIRANWPGIEFADKDVRVEVANGEALEALWGMLLDSTDWSRDMLLRCTDLSPQQAAFTNLQRTKRPKNSFKPEVFMGMLRASEQLIIPALKAALSGWIIGKFRDPQDRDISYDDTLTVLEQATPYSDDICKAAKQALETRPPWVRIKEQVTDDILNIQNENLGQYLKEQFRLSCRTFVKAFLREGARDFEEKLVCAYGEEFEEYVNRCMENWGHQFSAKSADLLAHVTYVEHTLRYWSGNPLRSQSRPEVDLFRKYLRCCEDGKCQDEKTYGKFLEYFRAVPPLQPLQKSEDDAEE